MHTLRRDQMSERPMQPSECLRWAPGRRASPTYPTRGAGPQNKGLSQTSQANLGPLYQAECALGFEVTVLMVLLLGLQSTEGHSSVRTQD